MSFVRVSLSYKDLTTTRLNWPKYKYYSMQKLKPPVIHTLLQAFNTSRPSDAYMPQLSVVQAMALFQEYTFTLTNHVLMQIKPFRINFSEFHINMRALSAKKMHLMMSSAKADNLERTSKNWYDHVHSIRY